MLSFFHEKGRYQKNKVRETGRRRNSNLGCGVAGGKFKFLVQGVQTLSVKSNLLILPIQSWSIYDSFGSN